MPETAEMEETQTEARQENRDQAEWRPSGAGQSPQGQQGGQGAGQQGRQQGQSSGLERRGQYSPAAWSDNPFNLMHQLADEMDRFFDDVFGSFPGVGSRSLGRRSRGSLFEGGTGGSGQGVWSPRVEVRERGNELVVCAELPGLKKDDVQVEVRDDVLTLQGERRQEHEENREGFYRTERSYGSFYRAIPLPEGVDPEQARASFRDGVLEVTVPLPQRQSSRGRRIEIGEGGGSQSLGSGGTAGAGGGQTIGSAESAASGQPQGSSQGRESEGKRQGAAGRTSEGGL